MEKLRIWCGQTSDQGRLRKRTEQIEVDHHTKNLETQLHFHYHLLSEL